MFVYLRFFYAFSLILVIGCGILVGNTIRSITAEGMAELMKRHDQSIARQYINTVWNPNYPGSNVPEGPMRYDMMATFRTASEEFTNKLPKVRFSVTDPTGKSIYRSNDAALVNSDNSDISRFRFKESPQDETLSRVLDDITHTEKGKSSEMSVVQTLIPILNAGYDPTSPLCPVGSAPANLPDACSPTFGVIEVVSDISSQWRDLGRLQMITTGSIIGLFVVLISILFFTTQRAEGIIAKQHEANMELVTAASHAEAENRDKSQFLANISHELRTPLNAIIGFSEIIKNEAMDNLNPTHQGYMRDINSSGSHLLSLINDILDFSKAEAGKLELDVAELDLSKLVINSMRLVIPRAEEAQVTLVEDLPKEHIVCATDGKKLKQVILNLLSNAVKFTPAGGEVRVSAWQKLVDGTITITVKDSGIGIAPKDIAKVMSPFGQVDSKLSRRYEGTGLGLPLSKKFVEALGGDFLIESEENVGTTITIVLPGQAPKKDLPEEDSQPKPEDAGDLSNAEL